MLASRDAFYVERMTELQNEVAAGRAENIRLTEEYVAVIEARDDLQRRTAKQKDDEGKVVRLERALAALTKEVERLRRSNQALNEQVFADARDDELEPDALLSLHGQATMEEMEEVTRVNFF